MRKRKKEWHWLVLLFQFTKSKDVLSVDDLKMQQTCIPQDGTYTDITYEGMQVLKVDFDANKKKIEQLLY